MTLQAVPDLTPDQRRTTAPGAVVADAVRRSFAGSPGRLRVIGAAGILATLLLAAVGTLAMQARSSALTVARQDAEQLVRVQTLQTALVQADADATNAYLNDGLEPPVLRADYEASLTKAATLLAEAARANPADAATLGQVNDALVRYAGLIESARANNRQNLQVGTAYLRQGSDQLSSAGLDALKRVADANSKRVAAAYTASSHADYQLWAVALIALAALIWAQYSIARRSHRYLNLPLAGATLALVVVLAVAVVGMIQSQSRADKVRTGTLANASALAQARVSAFEAKAQESRTLILRASGGTADQGAKSAYQAATASLKRTSDGQTFGLPAWYGVHSRIRQLDDGGDWVSAKKLAIEAGAQKSNSTFAVFDNGSEQALTSAASSTSSELRSAASTVGLLSWLVLVVSLLAVAGVWWGVSERLGEYR
jgi:hypothetical protein